MATLQAEGISGEDLMERAATAATRRIQVLCAEHITFWILCGNGNNGGDGLVIARKLHQSGRDVQVFLLPVSSTETREFSLHVNRLDTLGIPYTKVTSPAHFPVEPSSLCVIDAVFGVGCNRPPEPWVASLISFVNAMRVQVISIDIPSGMYADAPQSSLDTIVKATYTLTFQAPKFNMLLPETGGYVGVWECLDIGLDRSYLRDVRTSTHYVNRDLVASWYISRPKYAHKGNFGHCLVMGGSKGMAGAAVLAAMGALRAGAGLVSAWVPQSAVAAMQCRLPEVMVPEGCGTDFPENKPDVTRYDVLVVGPGYGKHPKSAKLLAELLSSGKPMVLDADALNLLSDRKDLWSQIPSGTVLTPHPGELRRWIGSWTNDHEKLKKVQELAVQYGWVWVIKGAHTAILWQRMMYFNGSGNPGMATGGSGDVLAGIIGGLLAQGYPALQAAVTGVWVHGRAGDLAIRSSAEEALTASQITDFMGAVFRELKE